ncbi:MAG TPA: HAMP domain-containing sensor histidine kinase, partial [Polyangiaceae bacterium]
NPISLHMQLLSRAIDRGDAAKSRDTIAAVRQIVQHGSELLEMLRRFSRQSPESAAPEAVDLNRLAHEAVELAKPRLGGREAGSIEIREDFGSPPAVSVRPGEVVSALLNVIVNAIDAMPEGGTIVVRTEEARGGALVDVVDDGPGMTPEVASHIFESFFTTKGDAGTGLGLAMVRGCTERHGGAVSLDTAPGAGTTIGLWFPPARAGGLPVGARGVSNA